MAATLNDLLIELQDLIAKLEALGFGSETVSVTHDSVTRPSLQKAIADKFDVLQAMVIGRVPFATKAALDASGAPVADVNGNLPLAQVWNDPVESNNGLYGWSGSAWIKSPYDIKNVVDALNKTTSVSGFGISNYIASKNPLIKQHSPNLPVFSDGQSLHLGNFIKDIKLTFSSGYKIIKDNGAVRRFRVNNVKYLSATQVYISWAYDSYVDGTEVVAAGPDYYVDIGGDVSNIVTSYSHTLGGETVTFDLVLDFSQIALDAVLVSVADFSNGQIAEDVVLKSFVSNVSKLSKLNDDGTIPYSSVVDHPNVSAAIIASDDDVLVKSGKNIYNKFGANVSGFLDENGVVLAHATSIVSYYMPVVPGIEYAYQNFYGQSTKFCTYDLHKNLIAVYPSAANSAPADGTFIPAGKEVYIRFSIRDVTDFMMEVGSIQSPYESFAWLINPSLLPPVGVSDFSELNVVTFGDSITSLSNNWTLTFNDIVKPKSLTNMAISGQKICWRAGTVETATPPTDGHDDNVLWNSLVKYQATQPVSPDAIIIAEGSNDISQASPLGTYAEAFAQNEVLITQQTMAGAFRKFIFKLMTDYPNAQIFYCTPIQSITGGRSYDNLSTVAAINREICDRLNVKVIDCLHLSGIQEDFEGNGVAGRYLYDGSHPSAAGALIHGKCVSKEFEKLYYLAP